MQEICIYCKKTHANLPYKETRMYHQQQNKWYPQKCSLAHNVIISYYRQVNSLQLKSSEDSKWVSKHLCNFGYHLFCC